MGFTSHNAKIHSESGLTKFTSQFHVGQTQDLPVTREDETGAGVLVEQSSGDRRDWFGLISAFFMRRKRQQGLVLCGLLSTTQDGPVDDAQKLAAINTIDSQQ
ncbi:hypothetical protein LguiB_034487 [Lonicera macranthoides]